MGCFLAKSATVNDPVCTVMTAIAHLALVQQRLAFPGMPIRTLIWGTSFTLKRHSKQQAFWCECHIGQNQSTYFHSLPVRFSFLFLIYIIYKNPKTPMYLNEDCTFPLGKHTWRATWEEMDKNLPYLPWMTLGDRPYSVLHQLQWVDSHWMLFPLNGCIRKIIVISWRSNNKCVTSGIHFVIHLRRISYFFLLNTFYKGKSI